MDDVAPDPYYWHRTSGSGGPVPTFGFPPCPGCWTPRRRPFRAAGLGMPWFSAYGNHDGLVQGNVRELAAVRPARHRSAEARRPAQTAGPSMQFVPALLAGDPRRSRCCRRRPAHRHRRRRPAAASGHEGSPSTSRTSGSPVGHGFTPRNVATARPTTRSTRSGCAASCSTPSTAPAARTGRRRHAARLAGRQLQAVSSRWISPRRWPSSTAAAAATGWSSIFSHHTIDTMNNVARRQRVCSAALRSVTCCCATQRDAVGQRAHPPQHGAAARPPERGRRRRRLLGAQHRRAHRLAAAGRGPSRWSTTSTGRCRCSARSSTTPARSLRHELDDARCWLASCPASCRANDWQERAPAGTAAR